MPAGEPIMRMLRARWLTLLLLAVASGLGRLAPTGIPSAHSSQATAAETPVAAEASPLANWASLRYTTSKFLIFTGEVVMSKSAAGQTVSVKTESRARIFGSVLVDSWSISTLDAGTGRPLSFESVQPRKRIERWDFSGSRLKRSILKPPPNLPETPMDEWVVTGSKTFPLPPAGAAGAASAASAQTAPPSPAAIGAQTAPSSPAAIGAPGASSAPGASAAPAAAPAPGSTGTSVATSATGATPAPPARSLWVYDYISMIAALRDLPFSRVGDETTVFIATSQGAVPMRISVGDERSGRRDLTDIATGRSRRYDLRELRLRVTPVGGSRSETRGFLNMEGETELWIDAATHTLTEITGTIPKVPGRVVISLVGYR